MTLKERPLINAVDQLGPIPGFMTGGSFSAGVFTILMCAVFGGFTVMFHAFGRGFTDAAGLYEYGRLGAWWFVAFGFVIVLISVAAASIEAERNRSADDEEEDLGAVEARRFFYGATLALFFLAVFDLFASPHIIAFLVPVGSIVGTPEGW